MYSSMMEYPLLGTVRKQNLIINKWLECYSVSAKFLQIIITRCGENLV
jgi:hypothetical protein